MNPSEITPADWPEDRREFVHYTDSLSHAERRELFDSYRAQGWKSIAVSERRSLAVGSGFKTAFLVSVGDREVRCRNCGSKTSDVSFKDGSCNECSDQVPPVFERMTDSDNPHAPETGAEAYDRLTKGPVPWIPPRKP